MTNIQLKSKKEIDLLAINPLTSERYHVESCVHTTSKLRLKLSLKEIKDGGTPHKYGIDYFDNKKFEHYIVKKYVNQIFDDKPYHKILVVWDTQEGIQELNKTSEAQYGIEVWSLKGIIYNYSNHRRTYGSRDDFLRIMELVFLSKNWEKKLDEELDKQEKEKNANKTQNEVS